MAFMHEILHAVTKPELEKNHTSKNAMGRKKRVTIKALAKIISWTHPEIKVPLFRYNLLRHFE